MIAVTWLRGFLLLAAVGTGACSAARATVVADANRLVGPVSLSNSVPGPKGETLVRGEDLVDVGSFVLTNTFYSFVWGLAPPWSTWDLTEVLNQQMRKYDGEAIVSLRVATESMDGWETMVAALAWMLPPIPTWIDVVLSGTVVRRRDSGAVSTSQ